MAVQNNSLGHNFRSL